jgi:hypothetical protein
VNIEKLDSLQATEVRNTFIAQPPEPQLLQWISESVLHALGDGGKGQRKCLGGCTPHLCLEDYVFASVYIYQTHWTDFTTRAGASDWEKQLGSGAVVSWDRAKDPQYLARVMKVTHHPIARPCWVVTLRGTDIARDTIDR